MEVESGAEFKQSLYRLLNRFLTKPDGRALFNLAPLSVAPVPTKPGGEDNKQAAV